MGICASCLGLSRARELSDEDESSRLLFEETHANHYGSFGDQGAGTVQADPQEVQRESEALQKVVAQTSNHLVDIFAMVPQNIQPNNGFPAQDPKLLRYQDVLGKMSTADQRNTLKQLSAESTLNISDGWVSEGDDAEDKGYEPVKSEHIGPLLGGFADADVME